MTSDERKHYLNTVIFGTDTPGGKRFDIALIIMILVSVVLLMMESLQSFSLEHYVFLRYFEWIFTFIFTIEYAVRIYCTPKPIGYMKSFMVLLICYQFYPVI